MNAWQIIKRLFVVHKCASCRKILSVDNFDDALCTECMQGYRVASAESCPECSRSARECVCQPKLLSQAGSLCLRKLYFYHADNEKEPQNRLIYFIKHHSNLRASYFVANELRKPLLSEIDALIGYNYDELENFVVVYVPRGRRARLEYGFDQSETIAFALAECLGLAYLPIIKRRFGGKEQKKLNAIERRRNMRNILYSDKKLQDSVKGKYVILFDDIVTTGTSMESCIKILRKLGAKGILCCCIATDLKKKKQR